MGDFNTVGAMGAEGIAGASSAAKGYTNYMAYTGQGAYQKGIADVNASLMQMQAADAIRRGDLAASQQLEAGKRVVGAQRAAIGASGVDVNSGSAAMAQEGARAMSAVDALTIENNAHLEALGYKMNAIATSASGRLAQIGDRTNADQSLIAGGMGLLSAGLKAGAVADHYTLRVPVENSFQAWQNSGTVPSKADWQGKDWD
jgi:hypothetical protein